MDPRFEIHTDGNLFPSSTPFSTPYMLYRRVLFVADAVSWIRAAFVFAGCAAHSTNSSADLAHDCRAANRRRAADCTVGRMHSTANCSWFSGREAGCRKPRGRLRGSSQPGALEVAAELGL